MMVDTATPADRDKSYKNMKCPETVTTSNNYDLATVRTGIKYKDKKTYSSKLAWFEITK